MSESAENKLERERVVLHLCAQHWCSFTITTVFRLSQDLTSTSITSSLSLSHSVLSLYYLGSIVDRVCVFFISLKCLRGCHFHLVSSLSQLHVSFCLLLCSFEQHYKIVKNNKEKTNNL